MSEMVVAYEGRRRFVARMRGHEIVVDLPAGGGGEDAAAAPPELFVASLGRCIGVYVAAFAQRRGLACEGFRVQMAWELGEHPTRIARITARVEMPAPVGPELQEPLRRAAEQCLVHNTITHRPEITIEIG